MPFSWQERCSDPGISSVQSPCTWVRLALPNVGPMPSLESEESKPQRLGVLRIHQIVVWVQACGVPSQVSGASGTYQHPCPPSAARIKTPPGPDHFRFSHCVFFFNLYFLAKFWHIILSIVSAHQSHSTELLHVHSFGRGCSCNPLTYVLDLFMSIL